MIGTRSQNLAHGAAVSKWRASLSDAQRGELDRLYDEMVAMVGVGVVVRPGARAKARAALWRYARAMGYPAFSAEVVNAPEPA